MKKLLLIDGNAIFHRAFHALPLFKTSKGEFTNAIYGFLKMMIDIILIENPNYLITAFDHKDKTFRHQEFTDYKANRSEPPAELYPQQPMLFKVLESLKIPVFQAPGFEADDIIGTLATLATQDSNLQIRILTGDKDAFQLVTNQIKVIIPSKGVSQSITYGPQEVEQKMGIRPDQIIDYKALRGDSSDNIPGVKGVGEKQAIELLQKYQDLDNIYNNLDQLKPGQRKKLEQEKEIAYLSQKMATIITNMPIKIDYTKCNLINSPSQETNNLFQELEFKGLKNSLFKYQNYISKQQAHFNQPSLF